MNLKAELSLLFDEAMHHIEKDSQMEMETIDVVHVVDDEGDKQIDDGDNQTYDADGEQSDDGKQIDDGDNQACDDGGGKQIDDGDNQTYDADGEQSDDEGKSPTSGTQSRKRKRNASDSSICPAPKHKRKVSRYVNIPEGYGYVLEPPSVDENGVYCPRFTNQLALMFCKRCGTLGKHWEPFCPDPFFDPSDSEKEEEATQKMSWKHILRNFNLTEYLEKQKKLDTQGKVQPSRKKAVKPKPYASMHCPENEEESPRHKMALKFILRTVTLKEYLEKQDKLKTQGHPEPRKLVKSKGRLTRSALYRLPRS